MKRKRKTMFKVELKSLDSEDLDNSIPQLGVTLTPSLCSVDQGVEDFERVGDHIVIKELYCRWAIRMQRLSGPVHILPFHSDIVRLIVYVDHQSNGTAATIGDVLDMTTGFLLPGWWAYKNLDNANRFTILCDKFIEMKYDALAVVEQDELADNYATNGVEKFVHYENKDLNIKVSYKRNALGAGGIAYINKNAIGVMAIARHGGLADVWGGYRIRYFDD